jgi:hypothetical protein
MTIDLVLANPPDLIATAMDDARARRADSQSGKRRLRLSKALRLLVSVVDWDKIVRINSLRGS